MGVVYEALLPSGLAVKYAPVDTATYMDAEVRAADSVGGTAAQAGSAAYQAKLSLRKAIEVMALSIRAFAGPVEFKTNGDGVPDVDAMMDAVDEQSWRPTNYVALMTANAPSSLMSVLADPRDFAFMGQLLEQTIGTVKHVQVFTGKVRRASE
jgi:hypothetical protein